MSPEVRTSAKSGSPEEAAAGGSAKNILSIGDEGRYKIGVISYTTKRYLAWLIDELL